MITKKSSVEINNEREWINQLFKAYDGEKALCPFCKYDLNVKAYVLKDHMGFVDMTCNRCGNSFHMSRVKYPQNIQLPLTEI